MKMLQDKDRCPQCGSSITVERVGLFSSYRVCARESHIQDGDGSSLGGVMLFPARG